MPVTYATCAAISASATSVATMDDFLANAVRDRLFLLTVLLPKLFMRKLETAEAAPRR